MLSYKKRLGSGESIRPFQIPLGSLITSSVLNFIASSKNIGTTHITNGSYRLHPVEWNIGESAGALAAYSITSNKSPLDVYFNKKLLRNFQLKLLSEGIPLYWFDDVPINNSYFLPVQFLALEGIIQGSCTDLHFYPDKKLQQNTSDNRIYYLKLRFGLSKKIIDELKIKSTNITRGEFAYHLFNIIKAIYK